MRPMTPTMDLREDGGHMASSSSRASIQEGTLAETQLNNSTTSTGKLPRLLHALSLTSIVSAFASTADCSSAPSPGASGVWLVKDAEHVGASRRRYFVLNGGTIFYYADANMQRLKGSIDLDNATVVRQGKVVVLGAAGRDWRLTADDAETAEAWVDDVLTAIYAAGADNGQDSDGPSGEGKDLVAVAVEQEGRARVGGPSEPLRYIAIKPDLIVRVFAQAPSDPLIDPCLTRIPVLKTSLFTIDDCLISIV